MISRMISLIHVCPVWISDVLLLVLRQNPKMLKYRDLDIFFTFTLPYIVIDFFLNNQPDAPIIQIYSVTKLYMFQASFLPIIRSFLLYIRHW